MYASPIEARYASIQKKRLIPLMMELEYEEEDWLQQLIGGLPSFQFHSEDVFDDNFEGLDREIKQCVAVIPGNEEETGKSGNCTCKVTLSLWAILMFLA